MSLQYRVRRDPFLDTGERVYLLYVKRRENFSLYNIESVSLLYKKMAESFSINTKQCVRFYAPLGAFS